MIFTSVERPWIAEGIPAAKIGYGGPANPILADMAWIETIRRESAAGRLAELYDAVADPATGQLDNIMAVHGLHPAGLRAHFDLYCAVMRGTDGLAKDDREMLALVVSQLNGCHY